MSETFRMRKLRLRRVDLVDRGAQPDAHVMLFKRRDDGAGDGGELEALVAKHRASGVSRADAVERVLDERPDLYRSDHAVSAPVVKAVARVETLRDRITAHIEALARTSLSQSAEPASRSAVAEAVARLLEEPLFAELAGLASSSWAVLPVDVAARELRALHLDSVDGPLDTLGL